MDERSEQDHHRGIEQSATATAIQATLHCLTGCAVGEILGMVISAGSGLDSGPSVLLSVVLAFLFGYGLTLHRVLRIGLSLRKAMGLSFASDTVSIASMELIDNAFILAVPGAVAAGLSDGLFWWSLLVSLGVAFLLTVPVNRWLIHHGRGHAVMHQLHLQ